MRFNYIRVTTSLLVHRPRVSLKQYFITVVITVCKYRYRLWADECSQLFGGLDVLAIQAVQAKDGREYIIDVSDEFLKFDNQYCT